LRVAVTFLIKNLFALDVDNLALSDEPLDQLGAVEQLENRVLLVQFGN
jgi:hypothetical protein